MQLVQVLRNLLILIFAAGGALAAQPAYAHGFGDRYDLPVPLEYYLAGAVATVALSFAVIGMFVRGAASSSSYWRFNLLSNPLLAIVLQARLVTTLIRSGSVFLLFLVIATSIWGEQDPSLNFSPTFVWVIWWVGMGFLVALLGNIWALVNPWSIIFDWVEGLYRHFKPIQQLDLGLEYPGWLGMWPAVGLFLGFAWLENSFPLSSEPRMIAVMVITYSTVTWGGMFFYGKRTWLRFGEAFSVLFEFFGRFAPTEFRVTNVDYCLDCNSYCTDDQESCVNCYECWSIARESQREINLRPYAVGLGRRENITPDVLVFVIIMLATVTFDGFKSTPIWGQIQNWLFGAASPLFGPNALAAIDSVGLLFSPIIFMVVYLSFAWMMVNTSGSALSTTDLAGVFVYSLIPIALAYNIAHFFTLLVIVGQLIIPLASDPFGYGWDILGTADYKVNIALVNAKFAWILAVGVIVIGHILAVYLAHVIAMRSIRDPKSALRSQYPMLALMVTYTAISLWIIAQPIVEPV